MYGPERAGSAAAGRVHGENHCAEVVAGREQVTPFWEQIWEQLGSILDNVGVKIITFWRTGGVWGTIWSPMAAHGAPGRQKMSKRDLEDPLPRGSAERPKIAKIWQEGRPKGPKGIQIDT